MKLLFVVNPISGGIDKEPFLKEAQSLCNKHGIQTTIFKTTGKEDKKKLKSVIKKFNPDRVAAIGGDGTTLFTAIALLKSSIPMGIIPLGSANGMATELNVNPKPIEAFHDLIMSNIIGKLDIVVVNDSHYSIHIGDVGVNAQIVQSYEKDTNRGLTTYAKYFLEEVSHITPFDIHVEANGTILKEKGVMVGICNAKKYGTGLPINIYGNPMDGKFEIVIIKTVNTNSLLKAGLSLFDESFYDNENTVTISTNKAKITFKEPRLLQLDGEVIGKFEKLKIEIIQGAIDLITTNKNKYVAMNTQNVIPE